MGDRKGKGKARAVERDTLGGVEVTEDLIAAEKSALLAQKQLEMEAVSERHDTMVRELFHMSHFVNMLGYDPVEAKQDNSAVFQKFKADHGHDLVDQASSVSAGPSIRRTRRAMNELQQALHASPMSSSHTVAKPKKKAKSQSNKGEIQAILSEAHKNANRPKGQPPTSRRPASSIPSSSKITDSNALTPEFTSITIEKKRTNKALSMSKVSGSPRPLTQSPETFMVSEPLQPESISSGSKTLRQTRVRKDAHDGVLSAAFIQPRKRRKTEPVLPLHSPDQITSPSSRPGSINLERPRIVSRLPVVSSIDGDSPLLVDPLQPRRTRSHGVVRPEPPPKPPRPPAEKAPPPLFNIKRIKLLVRRPPPTVSNPLQRPASARYNSSLSTLFTSYFTLGDEDITREAFETITANDAEIYEREILFRDQGRFIPGTDVLFGTKPEGSSFTTPQRTSRDIWEYVVADVVAYGKHRPKKSLSRQVSSQIAAKIQGYWDAQAARKDRAKAQEEKQLRILAKTVLKLVISEWKRVVAHLREEERLKLEAEELKRGAEHLDAILDQSGYILEAQQGDLSRGGALSSRSRSVNSSISEEEGSDSDDDDGGEDQDEDRSDHEADSVAPEGSINTEDAANTAIDDSASDSEDGDIDARALLADVPLSQVSLPSISEDEAMPETPSEITDELTRTGEPSPSDDPFSHHDSMDDTVVDDTDHFPQKSQKSSPLIEVPLNPVTLREGEDTPKRGDRGSVPLMHRIDSEAIASLSPPASDPQHNRKATIEPIVGALRDNAIEATDNDTGAATEVDYDDGVDSDIPEYLKPYAVAPVQWDPQEHIKPPLLLRGILRPYQQSGLEWLASLHTNNLNGILADEMGLGKTIQTIALLAHLACDRGIWGPHLIIVPTSVLLNWEMEFKKFLPGFKVLSYHGSTKRRKELRQGWNDKYHFNVCITSYTLASRDAHIFKRKALYYMILDEAHMIKNFRSQRWNILLGFRSFRRLLLTGTPLQNNLTELWALLQFLMSGSNFANLKEFDEWFSNPLEKMIEMGYAPDEENMQRVNKLHTVLRPYLLRRLKRDVEKELPSKYEHLVLCPLSKRQRFLYDEFMSRAHTRDALESGVYQKIANILMQLRKVCNHPDLFEVRPIVTSFAMPRSAVADFEIKELLIRRRMVLEEESVNLELLGLCFINKQGSSSLAASETRRLDATARLPFITEIPGEPPPKDTRTVAGFLTYEAWRKRSDTIARWAHIGYLNRLRCGGPSPALSSELLRFARRSVDILSPSPYVDHGADYLEKVHVVNEMVKTYSQREHDMAGFVDRFAFATPPVVALDIPRLTLAGYEDVVQQQDPAIVDVLHRSSVKLQIAFPDPSLLQYDCGKLQQLASLLREKKMGGHRCLIFTQMTKVLDILEIFMNLHGYLYLRLDGATKIEDRQYITERFNVDARIFCFISSSRSGGVGINLTGADTVIFYDSDFNPQMDRQCEDRAHRIGQIRDVHIYRFVSQHTVEEAMLRKANQKRSLDDLVIQKGEFDWRSLFKDESALTQALGQVEDTEDAHAADLATREEVDLEGADHVDFGEDGDGDEPPSRPKEDVVGAHTPTLVEGEDQHPDPEDEDGEDGGSVVDYMLKFVRSDSDFFRDWRL